MREEAQDQITEDINSINDMMSDYNTLVPSVTGAALAALQAEMQNSMELGISSIISSINVLVDAIKEEHPPGEKLGLSTGE